ncbi:MAG TPA: xanthine dehydrogenase family protein molybdopterin-binding subunit [Planctomycetota bacterium]|nr:xanthine dehydrogenase family protein molybdopterin-binding subunit [Planctomycetota bacterium]HRU51574.1 xanthine dehydrogenase family protein molybdopterin-binding subunit [Planctomycetota bacterium]
MSFQTIGKSPLRKDGFNKVTGKTKYIDDLQFDNCLYGKAVRSTVPRGIILNITYDPCIPWSEFIIVTAKDIPGDNVVSLLELDEPFIPEKEVRYIGEPIVLIAHENPILVEQAVKKIYIEYKELPAVFDTEEELTPEKIQHNHDNVLKKVHFHKGDVASIWDKADLVWEGKYTTAAQEHAYIEPQGVVACASPEQGVTVWGSIQCPYYVHKGMVKLFHLPEDKVRIVFAFTGGAFGGKEDYPTNLAGYAALLSWKANGRYVKMIYSREEDLLATTKRHPAKTYVKTAFSKDGKMLALKINTIMDGGAYVTLSPVVLSRGVLHSFGSYVCENVHVDGRAMLTNSNPYGAFRGFGAPQTIFALETHLNEVAHQLNIEPHELRKKNVLHKNDTMATGQRITENLNLEGMIDQAMKEANYIEKRKAYEIENKTNKKFKKGMGMALFFHGSGFTGSVETLMGSKVGLRITPNGNVEILTAQTEMGQGVFTTLSQIVAETLQIPLDQVNHVIPDTSIVPNSGPTVASRSCMIVGKMVQQAAIDLKNTLQQCKYLSEKYTPEQFTQAAQQYYAEKGELKIIREYKSPPGIEWNEDTYSGEAYASYTWACYIADVRIDLTTYQPEITDFVALQEVGQVVHNVIASGQIEGGVAQGIGWAIYENVQIKQGAMVNTQFTNYIIPTSADLPPIRTFFFENPYEYGPFGAKGIGELPADGPAAAIANAISFALEGHNIRFVPMLPEKLMDIIEGQKNE